jgi:homoserine dehydrogenase
MSTVVAMDAAAVAARPRPSGPLSHLTLLGCGNVGGALVRLLASDAARSVPVRVTTALVRTPGRQRPLPRPATVTTDPSAVFSSRSGIVVELLGGEEPARTLVLEALGRGIPVVTANKTLLSRHGVELREASAHTGTPLLYEAAVLAGVPFLGTFARRPLAAAATSLAGIANGTTNFLLSRAAHEGTEVTSALPEAKRLGYAEPDASKDLAGVDAAEKLAVLLQHFAGVAVHPDAIETEGIDAVSTWTIAHAGALGGVIKPVIWGDWSGPVRAFVGPAFVSQTHPLARVDGVENALLLGCARGRLLFQGPGAGPDVTAATVLDDVAEIVSGGVLAGKAGAVRAATTAAPETGWLLSVEGSRVPRGADVADYLGSFGIHICCTTRKIARDGIEHQGYLTWPAPAAQVRAASRRLSAAAECVVSPTRALGEIE